MLSSAVRTFTDPDDYAASIRGAKTELTVVGRGEFIASITRVDFHRLWMQRLSENLPRIMHSADTNGRAIISFHTRPGPSLLRGGVKIDSSSIARLAKEHGYFQRSSGPIHWGSMSLPVEDIWAAGAAVGCELAPLSHELIVTPSPAALAKLQRLHAEAGDLAENAPEIIANAQAARGLEQALIQAMVACLVPTEDADNSLARRRHERVMRRFHAAIAGRSEEEAVYIADLCAVLGVPERTLQVCCNESLGMGPKRYLLLRRMKLARQALRKATAATTSVTAIAANFGFWNFGRFAVEYKALYCESPSATLRNPAP